MKITQVNIHSQQPFRYGPPLLQPFRENLRVGEVKQWSRSHGPVPEEVEFEPRMFGPLVQGLMDHVMLPLCSVAGWSFVLGWPDSRSNALSTVLQKPVLSTHVPLPLLGLDYMGH